MKKLRVGLFGANGRMGREIKRLISESDDLDLFLAVNRDRACDANQVRMVDVWIDFTLPEALTANLQLALGTGKPYVCGTTGLAAAEQAALTEAARKIPVLWSANMSPGVTILNEALRVFADLKGFDFQIEEMHHIHKKDRPSGTALMLQKSLERTVGRALPEPVAVRGGGIFGIHRVFAMAPEETLTFEHTALNRAVFARGALQAARWLTHQKAGFYSMKDCLFKKDE